MQPPPPVPGRPAFRWRRFGPGPVRSLACLLLCGAAAWAEEPASSEPEGLPDPHAESAAIVPVEPETQLQPWGGSFALRTWSGYNDNPRLSSLNREGAAFVGGGGDLMIYRDGERDGQDLVLLGSLDHVGYLVSGFTPETTALGEASYRRTWAQGWSVGGRLEALYLRQVFDASEVQGIPLVIPAEGTSVAVEPEVGYAWNERWALTLEGQWERQWLNEPLDDYADLGGRLTLQWTPRDKDDVRLAYDRTWREFDDRPPREIDGEPLSGKLRYDQDEFDLTWNRKWDQDHRWRTSLRLGYRRSVDNGGGLYDYHRLQAGLGVRWVGKRLSARMDGLYRWYGYPGQTLDERGDDERRRVDLTVSARLEWMIHPSVRWFSEYVLDLSDENVTAADYRMNSVSIGLEMVW